MNVTFVRTCYACPEQYDAFIPYGDDGDVFQVGYLRLRHGKFTVECPDVGGQIVYQATIEGTDVGIFSDEERIEHLKKAAQAIGQYFGYNFVAHKIVDEWATQDDAEVIE